MRNLTFTQLAFADFLNWQTTDKAMFKKITTLLKDTLRNPYQGIGKPEALKHHLKGYWSRRINDEHRLVYAVNDTQILIIACKYHYNS